MSNAPAAENGPALHPLASKADPPILNENTRGAWASFVRELQRLEASGAISSDEAALAVAIELTEDRLVALDEESDVDADTVAEIIERVRETYGAEFEVKIARIKDEKSQPERKAEELLRERDRLEAQVIGRASVLARITSFAIFVLIAAAAGAAWILGLPGLFPSSGAARVFGWILVGVAGVFGFIDLVWGKHLSQWRAALEHSFERRLRRWLLGLPN